MIQLSREILKQHIRAASLLNYRPSHVAACAVLIAINVVQGCELTKTSLWNTEKTVAITGYSAEML